MKLKNTAFALFISAGSLFAQDWNNSLDLGISLSDGNSDSSLINVAYKGSKSIQNDTYSLSASYLKGESQGVTGVDEIIGNATWERAINNVKYLGARADYRADQVAEVDHRIRAHGFIGQHFIKTSATKLDGEIGLGYTLESLNGVDDNDASYFIAQKWSHILSPTTNLYQSVIFFSNLSDFSDHQINFEAGVENKLTEALNLKIGLRLDYNSNPVPGFKKQDTKIIGGVSYKF